MSELGARTLRVVLYEGPGATALDPGQRATVVAALLEGGHQVTRPAADGAVTPADAAPLLVLGQFTDGCPETREGDHGAPVHFRDIVGLDAEGVLRQADEVSRAAGADRNEGWKPWFPVIDYDRCTNCMQCLSFCLFDVYGVDQQEEIQVQNQDNCKTDCPACSRVCPEAAILFPKYGKGPINGDEVRDEDLERESMKVDISALLGGDIYKSLRERSHEARERFSTERDESKALLERKRCLKELKDQLDIPDEVLMTLPSAGDIEERARRAKEKMEKRMARSQSARDRQEREITEDDWGI